MKPARLNPLDELTNSRQDAGLSGSEEELRGGEFWREIPEYSQVDTPTFLDYRWQTKNSVRTVDGLLRIAKDFVDPATHDELAEGLRQAPMSISLTPYLLALINWQDFTGDPLRRQFLPVGGEVSSDHPMLRLDSLCERADSPVPGLTHRHRDTVLFLATDTCPVYCRFCTRSYLIGRDTEIVTKDKFQHGRSQWDAALDYIRNTPVVEDVLLSGGDSYHLRPEQLSYLGNTLLDIPRVRRIRFATKGPAIAPMKLLSHPEWVDALIQLVEEGRRRHKHVCLHTHFNHPNEITQITRDGLNRLFEGGVTVRNQSVLLRGVNDDADTMRLLVRRLGRLNVQNYYVYQQDMVPGVEDLRTPLRVALELEKQVRGDTAGFQTPLFVTDLPGGGGKRDVHSFESYDEVSGISMYRSPNQDPDAHYYYFDPIHSLPAEGKARWADADQREAMLKEVIGDSPHR